MYFPFSVAYKFGVVAMMSGLLGVPIGGYLAQRFRNIFRQIDPHVCAIGLLTSAPMVYFALISASSYTTICYMFIFFGEILLNLNWSIVGDILLVRKTYFDLISFYSPEINPIK